MRRSDIWILSLSMWNIKIFLSVLALCTPVLGCYPEEADQCVQIFRNSLAEAASGEDEGFCDRVNNSLGLACSCISLSIWSCSESINERYYTIIKNLTAAAHETCDQLNNGGSECNEREASECRVIFAQHFAEAESDHLYPYCSSVNDTLEGLWSCVNDNFRGCSSPTIEQNFVHTEQLIAEIHQSCLSINSDSSSRCLYEADRCLRSFANKASGDIEEFCNSVNDTLDELDYDCVRTAFWSCGEYMRDEYRTQIEHLSKAAHLACGNSGGRECSEEVANECIGTFAQTVVDAKNEDMQAFCNSVNGTLDFDGMWSCVSDSMWRCRFSTIRQLFTQVEEMIAYVHEFVHQSCWTNSNPDGRECNEQQANECIATFGQTFQNAKNDDMQAYCGSVNGTLEGLWSCVNGSVRGCSQSIINRYFLNTDESIAEVHGTCAIVNVDQSGCGIGEANQCAQHFNQSFENAASGDIEGFCNSVNGTLGQLFSCILTSFWSCGESINEEYKILIDYSIRTAHHACDNIGVEPTSDPFPVGLFANTTAAMNEIYELIQGDISSQDIEQLLMKLSKIEQRMQTIAPHIQVILIKLAPQFPVIIEYNDIMRKIEFKLDYFNREIHFENGSLSRDKVSRKWAIQVLSIGDEGLEQALHNLHDMILGHTLFSRLSIFNSTIENTLTSDEFELFGEYTLSLQASGYALLISAYVIKNWNMDGIREQMTMNMDEQHALFLALKPSPTDNTKWPQGTWGLPMPDSGCPTMSDFQHGYRFQDSEKFDNNNDWSEPNHFPLTGPNVHNYYCMKTDDDNGGDAGWPAGDYCIFQKDECLNGFGCGYIKWDDDNHENANYYNGTMPNGIYDEDTVVYFACRNDGAAEDEIVLPTQKPFYLFRYHDECQRVNGMSVTTEWLRWHNERFDNWGEFSPPVPSYHGFVTDFTLFFCYYEPIME